MAREIVAVYRDPHRAEAARKELLGSGFPPDRLHLRHTPGVDARAGEDRGAWTGAVLGGVLGFVVGGLGTILLSLIPALSWILAAEDGASVMGGAACGALLGTIAGGLGGRRSRALARSRRAPVASTLVVDADEHEVDGVVARLERHGPERVDRGFPAGPGADRMRLAGNRPPDTRPGRGEEPV